MPRILTKLFAVSTKAPLQTKPKSAQGQNLSRRTNSKKSCNLPQPPLLPSLQVLLSRKKKNFSHLPAWTCRSRIFQQARSNISHSSSIIPTTTTTTPNSNPTCNTGTIIDPHLNFKYPIKTKDGGPLLDPKPPEPGPIYTPKDLSESIANGGKQDAAYYIFEAVQGCQTKARNASAREKEFRVGGETNIGEGDGRMPVALRREAERMLEEQKRVQRNTLDVARDPRLQRR